MGADRSTKGNINARLTHEQITVMFLKNLKNFKKSGSLYVAKLPEGITLLIHQKLFKKTSKYKKYPGKVLAILSSHPELITIR